MKHSKLVLGGLCASLSLALGCSASSGASKIGGGGNTGGSGATGSGGSAASGGYGATPGSGGSNGGGSFNLGGTNGGGSGGTTTNCNPTTPDQDGDGFTVAQGDCNDCDPATNPGAYDVPGDKIDEDCDGTPDNAPVNCDGNIPDIGYTDPMAAARAIGLCQQTTQNSKKWGVISAAYVKADGSNGMNPLSHGLLPNFGPNVHVQEGKNMLMLSSGSARRPGDPGYKNAGVAAMGTTSQTPPGFPIDSPSCPKGTITANDHNANDPAALQLTIRVPTNAQSFSFQFDFYTWEYPGYICTKYNDFFVALQNPAPPNSQLSNISFNVKGNPVSVNNGFLEVCSPQTIKGKTFTCSKGTAELQGTGYENHAATSWLETSSPVKPGSIIQLRFAVWDMGDHVLSSSVLIDNFKWSAKAASSPGTKPVPVPQ